jgi:hypothetical protein
MKRLFFIIMIASLLAYSPLVYGDPTHGTQNLDTKQVNANPVPSTEELQQTDNKEPDTDPTDGSRKISSSNAEKQSTDNWHQKLNSTPTPSHGNTRNCGTTTRVQAPTHSSGARSHSSGARSHSSGARSHR